MLHPSEAALLAFADDELDAGARRDVSLHVDACGVCRHALRALREAMGTLKVEVALVDASEPAAWRAGPVPRPRPVVARPLSMVGESRGRLAPSPPPARPMRRAIRWAAALVLLVGGGAAAMTAPRWRHLLGVAADAGTPARIAATPPAVATAPSPPSASAAVSVLPVEGEASVSLLSAPHADGGRLVVRLSDRRDVQVTVTTPASAERVPRFLTGDGRLEVQLAGEGSVVEVALPSSLRGARVTHDGRAIVTVRGGAVLPAQAATEGIPLATDR